MRKESTDQQMQNGSSETIEVSLDRLIPDPALPPSIVPERTLARVTAQIRRAGQYDPLRARPGKDGSASLRVTNGRVRLAAFQRLGWTQALVTMEPPDDDLEVLYKTAVRSAGVRPLPPLEMAWLTARMVEEEFSGGSDAPQRDVAARLRAEVGSGSEPTVSRRIQIARHISPEWLAAVGIEPADLIGLSQRALGEVAKIEDGDSRGPMPFGCGQASSKGPTTRERRPHRSSSYALRRLPPFCCQCARPSERTGPVRSSRRSSTR